MIRQEEVKTTRWRTSDNKSFLNREDAVEYENEYIKKHSKHPVGRRLYFMYNNCIHCMPVEDIGIREGGVIDYVFKKDYYNIHMIEDEVFSEMGDILNHLKRTFVYK